MFVVCIAKAKQGNATQRTDIVFTNRSLLCFNAMIVYMQRLPEGQKFPNKRNSG